MIGRIVSIAWTITALFFVASAVIVPVIVVVRKAKARGRRLFASEPYKRAGQIHPDTRMDHRWDA